MNTMTDDTASFELATRLARLRSASAALQPPTDVEARLRARLFPLAARGASPAPASPAPAPRHAPTLAERWAAWVAWPVSLTAATGFLSWLAFTNPAVAPEQAATAPGSYDSRAGDAIAATPFLALTSLDRISASPRGEVISTTLPRATLADFGLPVSPLRAGEPIGAEFLVGADGGVLAVRFVETAYR